MLQLNTNVTDANAAKKRDLAACHPQHHRNHEQHPLYSPRWLVLPAPTRVHRTCNKERRKLHNACQEEGPRTAREEMKWKQMKLLGVHVYYCTFNRIWLEAKATNAHIIIHLSTPPATPPTALFATALAMTSSNTSAKWCCGKEKKTSRATRQTPRPTCLLLQTPIACC